MKIHPNGLSRRVWRILLFYGQSPHWAGSIGMHWPSHKRFWSWWHCFDAASLDTVSLKITVCDVNNIKKARYTLQVVAAALTKKTQWYFQNQDFWNSGTLDWESKGKSSVWLLVQCPTEHQNSIFDFQIFYRSKYWSPSCFSWIDGPFVLVFGLCPLLMMGFCIHTRIETSSS